MIYEIWFTVLGVVLSALSTWFARSALLIGLKNQKMMEREEELSRPCIAESKWEFASNDLAFCTLTIFPGRHFVQTKSVRVEGCKLSRVKEWRPDGGKKRLLSCGENLDVLPMGVSIPVNGPEVFLLFAVSPIPSAPFSVTVSLARDEPALVHAVVDGLPEYLPDRSS